MNTPRLSYQHCIGNETKSTLGKQLPSSRQKNHRQNDQQNLANECKSRNALAARASRIHMQRRHRKAVHLRRSAIDRSLGRANVAKMG